MSSHDASSRAGASSRPRTVLESVEEIRALTRRSMERPSAAVNESPLRVPPAEPYRPRDRPSMAVLTVFDDGDDSGELVRIRESIFVIGRTDGNLTIPHDSSISGRHLEISRRGEGRAARWFLRDLSSTNGTFVRAAHLTLQQDQEVLIGRTRLRFDAPRGNVDPEPGSADDATANATRRWQAPSRVDLETAVFPSLVELTAEGEGRRHAIRDLETWIGRDPGLCSVVLSEPTVDPRHGRLYRDARNRWILENARSSNGIWARIDDICLDSGGQFQCGEQRFAIKVL